MMLAISIDIGIVIAILKGSIYTNTSNDINKGAPLFTISLINSGRSCITNTNVKNKIASKERSYSFNDNIFVNFFHNYI
ncbi:hypothetical protein H263_11385 [Brachyspira hampsonii 30599]|nr:hypothetical protein H263_11385 [Brachyspira hampsonii 30599]